MKVFKILLIRIKMCKVTVKIFREARVPHQLTLLFTICRVYMEIPNSIIFRKRLTKRRRIPFMMLIVISLVEISKEMAVLALLSSKRFLLIPP